MATKGAQSNRTRAQLVIIIDVGSHCKVVCKSDAQDRDVLDFFKALYNGWW